MDAALPLLLDELAARAIASPIVERVDGWLLRVAPELPFRRANAALPLHATGDVETTIRSVEGFYARHGAPARVQVSSAAPPGLDELLAARGYLIEAPVDVLVAGSAEVRAHTTPRVDIELVTHLDDAWIVAYDPTDERLHAYASLLRTIEPDSYAATVTVDGTPAGTGVAIVERGWVGIFGMSTLAGVRRRGIAGSILHAFAAFAPRCYLQVEVDNAPAHALYARAGFTRAYGYHYRRRG